MIRGKPERKFELIYEMYSRENNLLNIKLLCEIAGVSRSGYYRWLNAASDRAEKEEKERLDFEDILDAYNFRGYPKGARSIHMTLFNRKVPKEPRRMNIKKIRRLMKKYNLFCPIRKPNPYRKILRDMYVGKIAANEVNREFREHGARAILLTDITYIKRCDGKFTYLSTIIDAYTHEVLAYVLSDSLEIDFVLLAIQQLVEKHGNELKTDTLIHLDQGNHYISYAFSDILKSNNLRQSMSRKANCWDNAPQESFFGHMKDEIHIHNCSTHEEICEIVEDWIDYYNNERYQWDLAKLSPSAFYEYTITGKYPITV